MRASWEVLKQDKELLAFPLLSGLCCLLILASFAGPLVALADWQAASDGMVAGAARAIDASDGNFTAAELARIAALFVFYCCNYFVIIFFNAGLIACAEIRMEGGDPSVSDGLRAAWVRLPAIAGWAVLASTVGLVLRLIEERSSIAGQIAAALAGMAWSLTSFLVVPILVIENEGPISALRRSASMLKTTWGEQIIGNFSFGLIFLLLALPGVVLVVAGIGAGNVPVIILAVVYFLLIALVQSALQGIFQAALYLYMRDGTAPEGFETEALRASIA